MNMKSMKKLFNRFSLTHGYRASYTINQFQTNLDFDPSSPNLKKIAEGILSPKNSTGTSIWEQFNPLIRVDMELKNSFKFLAELKTDRALSLSLDNNLLTESSGEEYILGMGYRVKDLPFTTRIGGRRRTLKGDLNIKADLAYRNNITVLRNLEIDNNQVTAGQTLWSIKVTADYALTQNLQALFFYDHNFSKFAISTAFPKPVFVLVSPSVTILEISEWFFGQKIIFAWSKKMAMNTPDNLLYTKDHEWVAVEGNKATIGITDFAQSELGDIVYVEVETLDEAVEAEAVFGTVEAVKTVSDLFMPLSGTVVEVNEALADAPEAVNEDPYGEGWMIKVELDNPEDVQSLLDAAAYKALIGA